MSIHTEINFENAICEHLANHGWLYTDGDASRYDRARALFPDDVLAWLQESQPDAWDAATKSHGANAGDVIVNRLRDSINQRGTLDVLRNGFEMLGQRNKLSMMQVKPALEINSQIMARYAANRLRAKTLELFGRRPNPAQPAGESNLPAPFHVYSMRQAIEEGFILDVLQNYTSYKLAFKLANNGKEWDEKQVERSAAMKGIMGWVRLHPYNISQKVQIIVEHFLALVSPLLGGEAKAMVVVASRLEAVRWQLAIQSYINEKGYPLKALVAFSGEVTDTETSPDPFTENSKAMNPNLKRRDIREAFKEDEYQILLVANKFQTGFDQPLLCGMYIDKRLAGIQAVQTLSRLNRAYPGKDTTYVLDFVNEPS